MRINKYLAACGIASRRAAEQHIRDGRVKVNGRVTTDLSTQIGENDRVEIDNLPLMRETQKVYIIMNKPIGCVTTCSDDKGRKTVLEVLGDVGVRVYPVGRLDYNTEGLLILTNDGDFARMVTHPSSMIKKTYIAVVDGKREIDGVTWLDGKTAQVTIHEGKNRQVRKMFEAVGLEVLKLKRVSIGRLTLGNLKSGEWKYISLANLRKML